MANSKVLVLTLVAWTVPVLTLAFLLFEALGCLPRASGLPNLSFGQVFGAVGTIVVLVATIRFAIVAPLLTVDVEKGYDGRRWKWSIIPWPPLR